MTQPATMPFTDLERIYEKLAGAIDRAGPERESLMLAKLALALANRLGDAVAVEACIDMAIEDLDTTEGRAS
jgi:Protein of unknown function (DUF2783)